MLPVSKNPGVTVSPMGALETPPAVAVICVVPGNKPPATPLASMLATLEELLPHVKATPVNTFPELSVAVAVNWSLCPTAMEG